MLRVQHHAQIEKLRLLIRKLTIGTNGIEDCLRRGVVRIKRMKKHALLIIMTALHLIGIRHDSRKACNQLHRLAHIVLQRDIVRIVVVRIQSQHGTRQLIHNIARRRFDDHILSEILRQFAIAVQHGGKTVKLIARRLLAEQKKPCNLLVAEAVFPGAALDNLTHINAAVRQLALVGDALTVIDQIAVHVTDQGQSRHHAGAVRIAQAALNVVQFKVLRSYLIVGAELLTQLRQRLLPRLPPYLFLHNRDLSLPRPAAWGCNCKSSSLRYAPYFIA